jgi:hypothetical protein
MAERVKRRVAAARLAVAFVAAGTIAGATAWAQAGPPPTAQSSAVDAFKKAKLDSSNIKNGSLLFQDFKAGAVPSYKMFVKLNQSFYKFKKAITDYKADIKGEVSAIKGEVSAIKGELSSYIKEATADSRYLKLSDAVVRGDGSVFNAMKVVGGQNPAPLISVPSLINVDALPGEQQIDIRNISSGDLNFSECGGRVGGGILKPGESVSCATGEHSDVMQLFDQGGGVVTLNFTSLPAVQAGARNYIIAILVGM